MDPPNSTIYGAEAGIDTVYRQILSASFDDVDEGDPDFFDHLRLVIGSIVFARKPLSCASLAKRLGMTPESIWLILTHLHSVLIVLESALEPIQIHHQSFADFITNKQQCPDTRYHIGGPGRHVD